jgi:plastocyanin
VLVLVAAAYVAGCGMGGPARTMPPGTPLPPDAVAVSAREYAFAPAALTIPAGRVTFAVTNDGTENHEFEILSGEQSLGKVGPFARGSTEGLTLTLSAGDYLFVCRLNGHDVLGMKGTLTVTGS